MYFHRNLLNHRLYFSISCFILYNRIKLYANASKFILSSVFTIPVTTSFSIWNCSLNIPNGPSTLDLLAYCLYILVFPFFGSLLFAFLNRILWWFYVFVCLLSICFVLCSFYRQYNYCRVFLFYLVFLGLCVVQYILLEIHIFIFRTFECI